MGASGGSWMRLWLEWAGEGERRGQTCDGEALETGETTSGEDDGRGKSLTSWWQRRGRWQTSSADEIAGDVDVRWAEKEILLLLLLVGGRRCGVEEKKKVTSAGVRLGQAVSQSVKSRSNSRIARMTASIIIPRTTNYIKDKIEGIGL